MAVPKKRNTGDDKDERKGPEMVTRTVNRPIQNVSDATHLKRKYELTGKVLGSGSFGKVYLASNTADKSIKVAIKVIPKKNIESTTQIQEEIKILKSLDHPNIIKYHETYETTHFMYVVMEYASGGELFDRIASKPEGTFNESEAASIMEKLFKAITHCHGQNVVHRDIKPENIMYSSKAPDAEVKLIDFGLSKQTKTSKQKLETMVGTPYYVAPEVLKGHYGNSCDLWSFGVVLYIMLSGYLPFSGNNAGQVFSKIQAGNFSFKQKEWEKVSDEGKDLIKCLLCVDPQRRFTAAKALDHPWFDVHRKIVKGSEKDKLDPQIIESMRQFKGISKLKKEAMNVLVKMLDEKDLEHLRQQFRKMDTDNSGVIDAVELETAIRALGLEMPANEIKKIIENIGLNGTNQINYTEFLAATISTRHYLSEDKLWALFKHFDLDDTGFITADNIRSAFTHGGAKIQDSEIDDIMKKHDVKKDGKISFDEFKAMMVGVDMLTPSLKKRKNHPPAEIPPAPRGEETEEESPKKHGHH